MNKRRKVAIAKHRAKARKEDVKKQAAKTEAPAAPRPARPVTPRQ